MDNTNSVASPVPRSEVVGIKLPSGAVATYRVSSLRLADVMAFSEEFTNLVRVIESGNGCKPLEREVKVWLAASKLALSTAVPLDDEARGARFDQLETEDLEPIVTAYIRLNLYSEDPQASPFARALNAMNKSMTKLGKRGVLGESSKPSTSSSGSATHSPTQEASPSAPSPESSIGPAPVATDTAPRA